MCAVAGWSICLRAEVETYAVAASGRAISASYPRVPPPPVSRPILTPTALASMGRSPDDRGAVSSPERTIRQTPMSKECGTDERHDPAADDAVGGSAEWHGRDRVPRPC